MSHRIEPILFTGQEGLDPGDEVYLPIGPTRMIFCWCPRPREPFLMGSPESEANRESNEKLHHVILSQGFWMAKYPCNQGHYAAVMGQNPSSFTKGDTWPVDSVTWDEAKNFCAKASAGLPSGWRLSLPSEAQWEYACRAGRANEQPFGVGAGRALTGQSANFDANTPYGEDAFLWQYRETTVEEGCFPPNDWGLHDLHGQLWEWCQDWRGDDPSGTGAKPVVDPQGPESGELRVLRGGSWFSLGWNCRSAQRDGTVPGFRDSHIGLRLVLVPPSRGKGAERTDERD